MTKEVFKQHRLGNRTPFTSLKYLFKERNLNNATVMTDESF